MIIIDGVTYNVPVKSIRMNADFLDKAAKRTQDGKLHRELIGVYFNYQLEFGSTGNSDTVEDYVDLWQKLTEPVTFHEVTVPDEDGDYTFSAYFSNVTHELVKAKPSETRFWKNLTVHFIAEEPARTP